MERLQDELEQERPEDGRLDALKAGKKDAQEEKETNEGSYQDAVVEKDRLNGIAREMKGQLRSIEAEIAELDATIKEAKAKALELSQRRSLALEEKNAALDKIGKAKQDKANAQNKWQVETDRLKDWITKAKRVIEQRVRVDVGETAESLEKKLAKLEKDLNRYTKE